MNTSRNAWILGAILLWIVLCSGCATSGSKPRLSIDAQAEALSHFSLGLLAESNGDPVAALRHLKTAIQIDPTETMLYPLAVTVALDLEQTDEALEIARKLRAQHPDALPPRLLEAQVCVLLDRTQEAETLFREAALDFPHEADSALLLARFFVAQQKNAEAIQILETAQKIHADRADILYLLGTLYVDRVRILTEQPAIQETLHKGIALLETSLDLSPENPQKWQQLGYAYLAANDTERAQTAFETAYNLFPADIEFARQLLDICILNGEIEQALMLCDELPRYTGITAEQWFQYLTGRLPEEYQDEFAGHLENYLQEQPRAPVLYYAQLGSLYLDQKKLPEAERVLKKAQTIYPENERVGTVIGYLHLQQERYEEAYTAFSQVQTNSTDMEWASNSFFTYNFMVAAQKSGRLEEAAEVLASSYDQNPVILNQYMRAMLTGETPVSMQSAIDLLNRFHALSPETAETLYYLTLLQADQKKYEEALSNARQFEALAASGASTNLLNGFFYFQYAVLHERTGKLDEAELFFRKAIDLGEPATAASAQNYIAYMWAERGEKLEMCLALAEKALTAEPDNAAYIDTLGWIYYMQGRYQEALSQLKKASELMSDDPLVWEHLGDTYLKLGNPQAAAQQWKKGLGIAPDDQRLIEKLKESGISPDGFPAPEDTLSDTPHHP
ncbi:MAG: tetratricopeptide repeat protein [Kiritimatiellales bacterium]|nr:tetratricopeptide repeat protein [Kiritimatiellota bacterium]MBL7012372.1 tetratricopeptide repeat protein [Kiritimatiellales bacterium]